MAFWGKKVKTEAPLSASTPLTSAVGKVHEETVFYTMPPKFLVPDKPPFWTAAKIWVIVAILMAGLIGAVYWLLVTAVPSGKEQSANIPSKSSDAVVLEPSPSPPPIEPPNETPVEPPPTEPPPAEVPPPVVPPPAAPLPSSIDTDQDGLTDVEEVVYGTDQAQPDSDSDGYLDGDEVKNGYNPQGSGRLVDSGLGKTYTSATAPLFTVVYPSAWSLERGGDGGDDVRLIASPDEFLAIRLEPSNNQTLLDWYRIVAPDVAIVPELSEFVGNHIGIYSPDRQTFYFIDANRPTEVFVVNYNSGGKAELNFRSIFESIIRSIAVTK